MAGDWDMESVKSNILDPLTTLLEDNMEVVDKLQEIGRKISPVAEEVGRIFFSNQSITVNAIPAALAIAALIALTAKVVFGLTLSDMMDIMTGETGYSSTGYGTGYGAPSSGYGQAEPVYVPASNGYSSRSSQAVELTPEQKALYPEITELKKQLQDIQDAEVKMRQHIYLNTEGNKIASGAEQISYGY